MSINFDDISSAYRQLSSESTTPWEVFSGEKFYEMAKSKGIPESKWSNDRVEMQLGQEAIMEELSKDVPRSAEEVKNRLRAFINRQVLSQLESKDDDVARKGMLLQALQTIQEIDEAELAELSQKSLVQLQGKLVDYLMEYTLDKVLPIIQNQCNVYSMELEQGKNPSNTGALAAACYLEVPELRNEPYVLGFEAGIVNEAIEGNSGNTLEKIAYGLLFVAAILAMSAIFLTEVAVLSAIAAHIGVEGTLVGLSNQIMASLTMASGAILGILKWALGSALLGALAGMLAHIFKKQSNLETMEYMEHNDTNHYISL